MKGLIALACGIIFGVGLAMSGMTDTAKVIGFLDIFGQWVPDLAFVMGGAVLVTVTLFRFVLRRKAPLLANSFALPTTTTLDARLLGGAALFGIGWGIYGYCPGPAISALAYLNVDTAIFVIAMLAGMTISNKLTSS
jgi:uncharacterized membrane protein YedE/YeeE